jgi:hypothetical protein
LWLNWRKFRQDLATESSTEEEEEEEDEERTLNTTYLDSSCSNSLCDSCSFTSSEDEMVEAKRIKLDPDYAPSTASDGTATPAATAPSSQVSSEEEEEEEDEETEDESYIPSGTKTEEENEPDISEEETEDL